MCKPSAQEQIRAHVMGLDARCFPLSKVHSRGCCVKSVPYTSHQALPSCHMSQASATSARRCWSQPPAASQPWLQASASQRSVPGDQSRAASVVDVGGLDAAFLGSPAQRLVGHALHSAAMQLLPTQSSGAGGSAGSAASARTPMNIREALGVVLEAGLGIRKCIGHRN